MIPIAGESPSAARRLRRIISAAAATVRLRGFSASKCKTEAKMAMARIKLLRNKRQATLRQMRHDIAGLLDAGHDDNARIRVEHVIREQNILAANDIIELFCELIVARLMIITKQRECPADLKEGVCSLIYASPRCSELPELERIRDLFEKKYGKDFVYAAMDLRPNTGVNHLLIEKLSIKNPTGEAKIKVLKDIAKEYHVLWDSSESEQELLKPPEEFLKGPETFAEASLMPKKALPPEYYSQPSPTKISPSYCDDNDDGGNLYFKDSVSAAQAAAEVAQMAAHTAKAAAFLAKQNEQPLDQTAGRGTVVHVTKIRSSSQTFGNDDFEESDVHCDMHPPPIRRQSMNSSYHSFENEESSPAHELKQSQSFNSSHCMEDSNIVDAASSGSRRILGTKSRITRKPRSEIKFDDSDGFSSEVDGSGESESESKNSQGIPGCSKSEALSTNLGSRVHPKLPDYDDLTARFQALKSSRKRGMF